MSLYYICLENIDAKSTVFEKTFETNSKEVAQAWIDEARYKRTWHEHIR